MSSLTPISTVLAAASTGWLSPDVLCDLLLYYSHYGFRLSATKPKPQPGALYLCDKNSMPDWFDDGYEWNLTGNGLLPIQNQPRLGFIQHQEERLSRRTSWLLDRENIILIHYLSTSKLQANMTPTPMGIPATPALTLPMSAVLPTLTSPIITPPLPSNNIMHTPMMGNSPFTSLPMPTPSTSGSTPFAFPSPSIAPSNRLAVPASLTNSPAATPSQTPSHSQRHPSPFTDDSPRPLKRANLGSDRSQPISPTERIPMRRETDAIMQTIKSSTSTNAGSTIKSTGDDKTDRNRARKAEVARACRKRKKAYIKTLEDSVNRLMTRLTQAETELDTRRMEEPNLYTNESPRMISDLSDLLAGTEEQDESVEGPEDIIPLIQRLDQLQKMRWVRGLHYMRHAIECLDPSPLLRVAVHGLDQKDDWYAPNAAFHTLFRKYAKVSPVKIQEIMSLRSATSPIRSAHDQLLTDLHTAYTTASHHLPLLQKHYDVFCTHLTPTQIARIHVTLHNRPHLVPPTVHSQQQQQSHHPPLPRPMSLPTRSTSNSSATSGLSVAVPHTPDTKVKLSPPSSPNKLQSTSSSTPTSRVTTRSASGVLPKRGSGSSVGTSAGAGIIETEKSSQSSGATSASTSSSASQSQSSTSTAPNSSPTSSSPPTPMAATARVVPSLPIAALTLSSMSTTTFASPQASPFSSPSASPSMPMRLPLSPSLMNAPATAPSTMTRASFPLHAHTPTLLKAQTLPTPKHTSLMSLAKHSFHPTAMASIVSPIATKYSNNTMISLHATMSPTMSPGGSSQASSLLSTPTSSAFQSPQQTPSQSRAPSPSPSPSPPSLTRSMDSPPLSTMTSRESTPRMETSISSSSQIQYGDSSPTVSEYDMNDIHSGTETNTTSSSSCNTTTTCTSETSETTNSDRTELLASTLSTLAAAANEETLAV